VQSVQEEILEYHHAPFVTGEEEWKVYEDRATENGFNNIEGSCQAGDKEQT
jgi:hypothetical protein